MLSCLFAFVLDFILLKVYVINNILFSDENINYYTHI